MNKQAALIIAQKDFHDGELQDLKTVLTQRKIGVVVVAKTRFRAVGLLGTDIKPDLAIGELEVKNFSAVIFIGGPGCAQYLTDQVAWTILHDCKKAKTVIAGSALAPTILANAGILIGKTATAFSTEEDELKNKGAAYTGMPVETDDLVVTSKDSRDAKKLAEAVAYLLEG